MKMKSSVSELSPRAVTPQLGCSAGGYVNLKIDELVAFPPREHFGRQTLTNGDLLALG